ncbi:MAG: LON peptidase substrate-binding domain-containing protein, partial [Cyanobacteria bacterium]|nr:LON peptidase substrate-binding domain-containing protein [Cyanobacteriota bacterium]
YYAVTMGSQRYKVEQYDTKSQPYLRATVSLLVEEDQRKVSVNSTLVKDVKMFFHEAVRLSHKIMKEDFTAPEFPDTPEALSYYVAENLRGNLVLKQELLETTSTRTRLKLENEILNQVVKTLAAQAQIEEAFK